MSRVLLPALLACTLLAAGCADEPSAPAPAAPRAERTQDAPRTTPSVTPATPSATPSAAPSPQRAKPRRSTPKIAPALPQARAGGAQAHLLSAAALPPAPGDVTWSVRSTAPEGTRRVGACQAGSMVDIGALDAVIRVFTGPDDSGLRSRQLVARLADAKSAWRSHEVLRAWRSDCEERLDHPTTDIGPMREVDLDPASAGHYRATYGPRRSTRGAGLGIVRSGRWISVIEVTAPHGEVPRGWTRRAMRTIAATFG